MTNPPVELVRPRMRQDVAFLETLDGVYVRGSDGAFVIRGAGAYRYLSALLPHLDGSTLLTDIVEGLPDAQAGAVRSLLGTLASRGVVLDGPGALLDKELRDKFPSQVALLEHHGDDGTGFSHVAAARVLITGTDQQALTTLATALTANGVGTGGFVRVVVDAEWDAAQAADADLAVLLALDGPSPQLFEVAEEARRAGVDFLPLVRVGDRLMAGPWQGAVSIQSALLRMSDNGMAGVAELWQAGVAGAAAAPAGPVLPRVAATMLINLAGFEIFKQLSGSIPSDLDRTVILLDPDRLTVRTEHVLPHPAVEPTAPAAALPAAKTAAPEEPVVPADDGGVEWAYRRFDPVVADAVGLFRHFDDDAVPQIPVKTAVLRAPAAATEPIVTFGVETVLEARLASLEDAAIRYTLNLHRRSSLLSAPAPGAEDVVSEQVETWLGAGPSRPAPVAAYEVTSWTSLAIDRAAVLAGPLDWNAAEFEPDLGGLAAAPTPPAAISRALVAAVGSTAIAEVASGELPVVRVPQELIAQALDPQQYRRLMILFNELVAAGDKVDFQLARGAVPVAVVAISNGVERQLIARAATSWVAAAEAALLTAVGERQLAGTPYARVDHKLRVDADLGGALVAGPAPEAAELTDTVADDAILAKLAATGRRAATVDLSPPDLTGVTSVARVLLFRTAAPDAKES
ncbi:hypothetical protein [Kribbella sp. VKM Ac-2568]|uniref:hypothetical protein n=1 Tax=Kribbella sp. VKM Ac-2568 TaxID=2512219 RepID=UPI00104985B5|nr:hypothetical protein [Kribbella sp. VKM Ac-2568]TCM51229.1 hypothetical protein EV648_10156 [Kribbella sp. VKM Ac-2568]